MTNIGKELRLSRVFSKDKNIILDTSFVNVIGAPKALIDFEKFLGNTYPFCDAIVLNQGQIQDFIKLNKNIPLILRCNWTNALRDNIRESKIFKILTPSEALYLGAEAIICYFVLGGSEEFEKENINLLSYFAVESDKAGIPLIGEVIAKGVKINKENFSDTLKLAVSMLTEIGVDAICIPEVDEETFKDIKSIFNFLILQDNIDEFLKVDVQGLKLGYDFFKKEDYLEVLKGLKK